MLTSWRSEIGKASISVIEDLWKSNPIKYRQKEQQKVYAKTNLDRLNYLYKYPGQVVSAIACVLVVLKCLIICWVD
jgi:hypothetical protein